MVELCFNHTDSVKEERTIRRSRDSRVARVLNFMGQSWGLRVKLKQISVKVLRVVRNLMNLVTRRMTKNQGMVKPRKG
jgi:hypothetical protein